jgi:hypothetical protein
VAGALAPCFAPRLAVADDKAAICIDSDTQGQELRLAGRWREAEARFQTCAHLPCPEAVLQDCVARYDDIRAAMPTLLVAAQRADGTDTIDATLVIDGKVVAEPLPTTAIELDPGVHVLQIRHDGWTAPSQTVVLREGDKDRTVAFRFDATDRNVLPLALAVSGGLVFVVGATFVTIGIMKRDDLVSEPCAATRTCSPADVNAVDRDYWIGGIAAGIGLGTLGLGIWQLVSHGKTSTAAALGPGGLRVSF